LDLLRVILNRWKTESAMHSKSGVVQPDYYLISVDFSSLHGHPEGSFFESLPTNFHLSSNTVDRVIGEGDELLKNSPEFQRLLSDLRRAQ
jgi:hypothetical protein